MMRRLLSRSIALLVRALTLAQCSVALFGCLAGTSGYGQDANGIYYVPANSSDFGKAINTVLAQCPVSSIGYAQCEIHLPSSNGGNWETTVTITSPGVSIVGQGSYASVFHCSVNGDCLHISTSPFTVQQAGRFQGFQLVGSGTPNGVGIHLGEIEAATWQDLDIQNFNGAHGVGLWLDNAHANGKVGTWTERNTFTAIHVQDSTTLIKFSMESGNPSFGYNRFLDLRLNPGVGHTAFDVGAGTNVYHCTIRATVNADTSTSVITVEPASGSLPAGYFAAELHLFGEGAVTNLFKTAVGSQFYLYGDSAISWAGDAPPSTLLGESAWFMGLSDEIVSTATPTNQVQRGLPPLTLFTPHLLGGGDVYASGFTQELGVPVNVTQNLTGGRWALIATLPAEGANNSDGLDIRLCGGAWTSAKNCGQFELWNRGGFGYQYMSSIPTPTAVGVRAYQTGGPGTLVNIYAYVGSQYYTATSTVFATFGGATLNYGTPTTSTPAGTLIFDSTNPTTYPANTALSVGSITGAGAAAVGTPATSSAACTPPQVEYDSAYVYTCVATNTWRRTPTSSF